MPSGWANDYRYTFDVHIDPKTLAALEELSPRTPAVVIYVDRFSPGGYRYLPLRRGHFLRSERKDSRVYVSIELTDYVFPTDLEAFQSDIAQALPKRPVLTNGDPQVTKDGSYVLLDDSVFESSGFVAGDDAWCRTTDAVARTQAFAPGPQQDVLFVRPELWTADGKKLAPIETEAASSHYVMDKDTQYELRLPYRYPSQSEPGATAGLRVTAGDSVRLLADGYFVIDSSSDLKRLNLVSKKYLEDSKSFIALAAESRPQKADAAPIFMDRTLEVHFRDSKRFWFSLSGACVLFALLSALNTADISKLTPLTWDAITAAHLPVKILIAAVQTAALYWMFRVIGKKIT